MEMAAVANVFGALVASVINRGKRKLPSRPRPLFAPDGSARRYDRKGELRAERRAGLITPRQQRKREKLARRAAKAAP